jgi:small-conductance mechanosensitive channel
MEWVRDVPGPDWFFIQVPSDVAIASLVAISVALIVWAQSLIRQGYAHHERLQHHRLNPRHYMANNFEFWLGAFMLSDAIVYILLASLLSFSDEHTIDLWLFLLFLEISLCAIMAFYHWAISRLPRAGS